MSIPGKPTTGNPIKAVRTVANNCIDQYPINIDRIDIRSISISDRIENETCVGTVCQHGTAVMRYCM